ncbi:AAA family ATPase [Methyloversatilis sp.]|uniref:AAA family ATPase n=1 Tax=Methyloversatilis sp. TaxID=2569862 RepID=UPI002735F69F|nr:AAA family ATPase [Methyloversatilis sp.]MDP2867543.1 AAA family ATPase [Methyloversatilis sp.]MDP3453943.1 AAA family ATPase [Methyloversatilis sp.]MDP3578097.1 AAA family ATPase [Methyloversatilis sp.]
MNSLISPLLSDRLRALAGQLECGLVERRVVVRRCLLTALAGEHTLLIGPPGTAKSELARRLRAAFRDARYFERLLTRFTVPEELFGPLSIRALEEDRYERHTAGFLPDASIAFIDEVFKANSAILNALLTLLNEREFDNGAGRQHCPLVSVIGATNDVPEDEVGEAFFDRFLTRLPIAPVSADGFAALLDTGCADAWSLKDDSLPLTDADLAALAAAAREVALPGGFVAVLSALRTHIAAEGGYVSDRRWVKTLWLLRVAAASEGRTRLSVWDLLLLPACVAPDATRQSAVAEWLTTHLGVREACAPARLARVVQAFEAQLEAERKANDLDYDEAGRLRFSASDMSAGTTTDLATDLAEKIGDAKGGAGALRMSYSRQRRYGPAHIGARTAQIDDLLDRIAGYQAELDAERASLADCRRNTLWLDDAQLAQVERHLATTASSIADLATRARDARRGFENLPRLPADVALSVAEAAPEPVLHEPLT